MPKRNDELVPIRADAIEAVRIAKNKMGAKLRVNEFLAKLPFGRTKFYEIKNTRKAYVEDIVAICDALNYPDPKDFHLKDNENKRIAYYLKKAELSENKKTSRSLGEDAAILQRIIQDLRTLSEKNRNFQSVYLSLTKLKVARKNNKIKTTKEVEFDSPEELEKIILNEIGSFLNAYDDEVDIVTDFIAVPLDKLLSLCEKLLINPTKILSNKDNHWEQVKQIEALHTQQ